MSMNIAQPQAKRYPFPHRHSGASRNPEVTAANLLDSGFCREDQRACGSNTLDVVHGH
ncbi:MAG: hypothetical protein IPJ48_10830 [Propionivibrio sp.]|uniref:Uncharacterized protein n=1 Tax=Candidatus Propionivibrio dominans TaxID=2954373 RepID=A0A9D7IHE2_9RHOO|nr:hypothetical protein [Candidatus Propionivibrio dominans]